jgi:hypothetical protein
MPAANEIRYEQLGVYERTLIEVTEAFIASGQYAPGPLVMALAKDATQAIMNELGLAQPYLAAGITPLPYTFKEWNKKR